MCVHCRTSESAAVLGTAAAYHLPPGPGAALLKVDAAPPQRFTAALVSSGRPSVTVGGGPPRVVPFTPTRPPGGSAPVPDAGAAGAADTPATLQRDLDVLVAGLAGTGARAHQVWLEPLGAAVPLDGPLATGRAGWLRATVGLVDRPLQQAQEPLVLDFSGAAVPLKDNDAPRTAQSTLLCTIVAALAAGHRPDAVQVYAIDLVGGLLHRLAGLPYVGAVC